MRLKLILLVLLISVVSAGVVQAFNNSIVSSVTTDGGCEGIFFDLRAGSEALMVTGFETVLVGTANVRVYTKPGSYAGFETSPGAWTLRGAQTIAGGSGVIQTLYPLNVGGIVIPAGETVGILIYSGGHNSTTMATRYQTGATLAIANADLALSGGSGSCGGDYDNNPFDGFYTDRAWRGVVHYTNEINSSFADGRINRFDPAAAFAVYPHWDAAGGLGLTFYDTFRPGLLLVVSAEEIAAVPEFPAQNTLIAASADGRVSLYRLMDGQFQAMGPAASGKQYGVIFPVIDSGTDYDSFEE